MPTHEENIAKYQEKIDADVIARKKRDDDEFDALVEAGTLPDRRLISVLLPGLPPDMPGRYIGRIPSQAVAQKFRHTMWGDSAKSGMVEAKSKAGAQMASQQRVYPTAEQYSDICDAYPMVVDRIAQALVTAAEAGAEQEGKE